MAISKHVDSFAEQPVAEYDPANPTGHDGVYRLTIEYDSKLTFPELLDHFLLRHGGPNLTALVIGSWGEATDGGGEVVQALVSARDRMPNLKSLFLGDITYEECEMSWIQHGDVSELLPAFPSLEEFRLRGTSDVRFGTLQHANLRSFAVESGGLDAGILGEILAADFPSLTQLEIWLGTASYGGIDSTGPLEPLFAGNLFPNVRSLGLRNSTIADAVAARLAESPLLSRLDALDLSLGNLSDEGGEALLDAPAIGKLQSLNLRHHYMSDVVMQKFQSLGIEVDLGDAEGADTDPEDRYITVGE